MKINKIERIFWFGLLLFALIVVSSCTYYIKAYESVCVDEGIVEELLKMKNRTVTFRLEDGRTFSRSHVTIEKGSPYCVRGENVKK